MKTDTEGSGAFLLPTALRTQIEAAAEEEHRPAKDVLQDAVERYLRERHPPAAGSREGFAAAEQRLRELRKGTLLPEGVTIRNLINEGRA